MKFKEKMVVISLRVPSYQKDYLEDHRLLSGNKPADIIRLLLDYYITLGDEDDTKQRTTK